MPFQGGAWETNVYLEKVGIPALGILFSAVTVKYRKMGQLTLTTRTLLSTEWTELGGGIYAIKWPASFTNILGSFIYTLSGVAFDNFLYDTFEIGAAPISLLANPAVCIVSGNLVDIGGQPSVSTLMEITFKPVAVPAQVGGTSLLAANLVKTIPDVLGNFQVTLVQGKDVVVEIPRAGIRHQISIPMQGTAQIIDLLPPFP